MRVWTLFAFAGSAFFAACGGARPTSRTASDATIGAPSSTVPVTHATPAPVVANVGKPIVSGPPLPKIVKLSRSDATCGLDDHGRAWSFGPDGLTHEAPSVTGAVDIACGMDHTCVVMKDGTARCWGGNSYGCLGDGTEKAREDAAPVAGLAHVAEVQANAWRTCARTTNGDVYCWGDGEFGKNGDGRMPDNVGREKLLPGATILHGATTLAVGDAHALSVMQDGSISCWGQNNRAACGAPYRTRYFPRPKPTLATLKNVVDIRTYDALSCALDRDGKVWCWGDSMYGGLGPNGPTTESYGVDKPVGVPLPEPVTQIAVGSQQVCAILKDATVWCWGHGEKGELGDGKSTLERPLPARVPGLEKIVGISAGLEQSCALTDDGRVFCWGDGFYRETPSSSPDNALSPVQMTLPTE